MRILPVSYQNLKSKLKLKNISSLARDLANGLVSGFPEAHSLDVQKLGNFIYSWHMDANQALQKPELIRASILMGDIRGFTQLSEHYTPLELINILNIYLSRIISIIEKHNGIIDKIIGDAVMVVFNAESKEDILNTLLCAVEMQIEIGNINKEHAKNGGESLYMGIGINTGEVAWGAVGSDTYHEFTIIGNHVNLAARVESYSMRGQILISDNTYALCNEKIRIGSIYDVSPKGKYENLKILELTEILAPASLQVPRLTRRRYVRVQVGLNILYSLVEGKNVTKKSHEGTILDISYTGIGMMTKEELPPLSDIRLKITLPFPDNGVFDIYAKAVHSKVENGIYFSGLEFTAVDEKAQKAINLFVDKNIPGNLPL